jgi:hypothetical protein
MMHNPPHPGEILRADYLEPLGLMTFEWKDGDAWRLDLEQYH